MSILIRLIFGFSIFLLLFSPQISQAQKRVALVIGNSDYENAPQLPNPRNDANDIASSLQRLDFEVILGIDLDYGEMRDTVRKFSAKLDTADVALFFYAGHAVQLNGINYLAPTDTKLEREADLEFETITLDVIQGQMDGNAKTLLVFLDACRNNPFLRNFSKATRSSDAGSGLARPVSSPEGEFIAFATQPGNVALDGDERNSPFTKALLNNIERPGVEISSIMTSVRREVYEATSQQQLPWTNSALLGDFYFTAGTSENNSNSQSLENRRELAEIAGIRKETAAWNKIKDSGDVKLIGDFQSQFRGGVYENVAAETLRLLREKQSSSEKSEVALLVPEAIETVRENSDAGPDVGDDKKMTKELTRSIQKELTRLGCNAGRADGIWGPKSKAALQRYTKQSNSQLASIEPLPQLLDELRLHENRVCPISCGSRYNNRGGECILKTCSGGRKLNSRGQCIAPSPARKRQATKPTRRKAASSTRRKNVAKRPRARKVQKNCFRFNGNLVCE